MLYPHPDDPYEQPALPYQPYIGPVDALVSRQQETIPPRASTSPRSARPARPVRAELAQPRMSKAEALEFVDTCKRWLIAGSIVAFGILSGLIAAHVTGATSNQATPSSNAPTTSPSSGGGFFQRQQGGYYFGNGNSGQPSVSGSHVS